MACGGGESVPAPPGSMACATGALASGAADATFALAAWPDRDYDLVVPPSHVCGQPIGVVVALHGGGSNKEGMRRLACPDGDLASPRCLHRVAAAAGLAMAHRLACQAPDLVAAVAPVSGQNQSALAGCAPSQRVAVLDIHGTLDACWPYAGGNGGCLESGLYVSVDETLAGWAARNACAPAPMATTMAPIAGVQDGTSVVRRDHGGCAAGGALAHLEVVGNGHFWPGGHPYASGTILGGVMSRQLDTGQAVIDFFAAHARP